MESLPESQPDLPDGQLDLPNGEPVLPNRKPDLPDWSLFCPIFRGCVNDNCRIEGML
jgi:hypothetical protein